MSHTVKMNMKLTDKEALAKACAKLGYKFNATKSKVKLYSSTEEGLSVEIPNWKYPIAINELTGETKFDNYNGSWGKTEDLNKLTAHYGLEKAKDEVWKKGYSFMETIDEATGNLNLKVYVG